MIAKFRCVWITAEGKKAEPAWPVPPRFHEAKRLLKDAALMLAYDDAAGIEGRLEHRERLSGFCVAAHEHVESRIAALGPCMYADMTLGEHGHSRHAASFRERMKVDVKERRSS